MIRRHLSLRAKLLLASSVLVILPYLGYRYINEVEAHLRAGLEASLRDAASAMAGVLDEQAGVESLVRSAGRGAEVLVHNLGGRIQVDGYAEDWRTLGLEAVALPSTDASAFAARYTAGRDSTHLYLLVEVDDGALVYPSEAALGTGQGDHLILHVAGLTPIGTHVRDRYLIDTVSPGWAGARQAGPDDVSPRRAYRVRAEWVERTGGYNVELRLPLDLARDGLALAAVDIRPGSLQPVASAGEVDGPPGALVVMSPDIEAALAALNRVQGQRVRVLDREARVRARHGHLNARTSPPGGWRVGEQVLRWLIGEPVLYIPPQSGFTRSGLALSGLDRVTDTIVQSALAGQPGLSWQRIEGQEDALLRAAHPVRFAGEVVGAVLVERTANTIQTVRRAALTDVLVQTLAAIVVVAAVFAWFATRLGGRLARLRDEASQAIDPQGRVVGAITATEAGDEIGDLGRSIGAMLERLRRYNEYLELLAQRLTHELRTPIAVIRSSLDNLEHAESSRAPVYTARAMEGLRRLDAILARMAEATRLEQTVHTATVERFELTELITAVVAGYRQVWPGVDLTVQIDTEGEIALRGVPDLIVQALDKLVGNAVDFGEAGEPVALRILAQAEVVVIEVDNIGPPIPESVRERIFDSMVSGRDGSPEEPHLGLGLYIVRMVSDLHQGEVRALARPDGRGVVFRLTLPRP